MDTLLLLQPFFLALVLIGWLVYKLLRTNKNLQDKEQQVISGQHATKHFFQREIKVSRSWLVSEAAQVKPNDGSVERARRLLYAIRHHWFREELKALSDDGQQPSDIRLLEQDLIPFCEKLLKSPSTPTIETSVVLEQREKTNPLEQLQKQSGVKIALLEAQLTEQRKTIETLRQQLETVGMASPSLAEQCQKIESSHQDSNAQISQLNTSLASMRQQYDELQKQLQHQRIDHHESGGILVVQSKNKTDHDDHSYGEAATQVSLEKLQNAYHNVMKEMEHLREANSNKRQLILQLEQELKKASSASADPTVYHESEQLIEKLKIQLRDSEMCTAVLEAESDEMRLRLDAINHSSLNKDAVDSSSALFDEHQALKKSAEFKTQLMRCSSELIACKTIEDVTRTLIGYLIPTEFGVTLYMTSSEKDCWMSTTGSVASETKDLMMSIAPDDEWLDTRLGALLSLKHCRVLLSHIKQSGRREVLQDIAMIVITADSVALQLELMQKRNQQRAVMAKIIEEAKKSLAGLDVQNKYMADEGGRTMKNHYDQMNNFVETLGLTEIQKTCATEILEELKARMQILFGTRVSLDSTFANLIVMMDKKTG